MPAVQDRHDAATAGLAEQALSFLAKHLVHINQKGAKRPRGNYRTFHALSVEIGEYRHQSDLIRIGRIRGMVQDDDYGFAGISGEYCGAEHIIDFVLLLARDVLLFEATYPDMDRMPCGAGRPVADKDALRQIVSIYHRCGVNHHHDAAAEAWVPSPNKGLRRVDNERLRRGEHGCNRGYFRYAPAITMKKNRYNLFRDLPAVLIIKLVGKTLFHVHVTGKEHLVFFGKQTFP